MQFEAVTSNVKDTLKLDRRYKIPKFQREYSWGKKEVEELWNDLLQCLSISDEKLITSEYFIGSIVLVRD